MYMMALGSVICLWSVVMHYITVVAVSVGSASAVVIFLTVSLVYTVMHQVSADTDYNGKHEKHSEEDQCLVRNHRKHYECFVSG